MEKRTKQILIKAIKKKLKIRYIVFLIVLLSTNTFAWFIYAQRVESDLTVSVRAWKVLFESGDSPITDYIDISVDNIFPGMTEFSHDINAYNRSDVSAQVTYTLLEANIMGDKYVTVEGKDDRGLELDGTELTSDQLVQKIENEYPFKIVMSMSTNEMDPEYGVATYNVKVNWAYESGDDEADTYWGIRAYDYREENPDSSCINLIVLLSISQKEGG